MNKRTFRTGLAAAAATAVLAAACGSDGDSGGAATPDEPTDEVPEAEVDEEAPGDDDVEGVEIDEAALQGILDRWRTDVGVFGATLSIRVPGHDDVHLASGVDDRDITSTLPSGRTVVHTETPMPTDGTYSVDAISRTFVAAAAMQLVDEGRFVLDEPVEPWLPELPGADKITLAMLLAHTTGLGEWDATSAIIDDPTRSYTPEEVLANHLAQPLRGQPGGAFALTDADTVAAGLMIQRELDQDLGAVYEQRFFEPLGLDDTRFSDGSTNPTRHGWFSLPDNPDPTRPLDMLDVPGNAARTAHWASGSVDSSSQDMLAWGEALFSGDLLGEDATATIAEMRNANPLPFSDYYGLGVSGYCLQPGCGPNEVELVGRSGALAGSRTLLVHQPDSGTTLMVHVNTAEIDIPALVDLVAAAVARLGPG